MSAGSKVVPIEGRHDELERGKPGKHHGATATHQNPSGARRAKQEDEGPSFRSRTSDMSKDPVATTAVDAVEDSTRVSSTVKPKPLSKRVSGILRDELDELRDVLPGWDSVEDTTRGVILKAMRRMRAKGVKIDKAHKIVTSPLMGKQLMQLILFLDDGKFKLGTFWESRESHTAASKLTSAPCNPLTNCSDDRVGRKDEGRER